MEEAIRDIIGPDSNAIAWWQMVIRGIITFIFTLVLVRAGDKRIFGKTAALDIVLGIILGSILSRAITGNAPFFGALITSAVMVTFHWLLAKWSCYSKIGQIVKGNEQQLVKNGEIQHDEMNKRQITDNDLYEAMRLNGKTLKLEEVEAAYLERSGDISIITKK